MQPEAQAALRRLWLKQEQTRYQQRVHAHPDDASAWRHLARLCWEAGHLESALEAFDRILVLQPEDSDSLLGRIMACLTLGRNEEALATSMEALKVFPEHADVLRYQIELFQRLGRIVEALEVCDRLLALLDLPLQRRLDVLHNKATFQFQINQREESLATVEQALTLVPDDPGFRLNRARLFYQSRRFVEALTEIESLVEVAPLERQCTVGCLRARILARLERFAEADAILQQLQEQYPHEVLEREFEPWRLPEETLPDSLHKRYTGRGLYLIDFFDAQSECDWRDRENVLSKITDWLADALKYGFVAGMEPFNLLTLPIDPALQLAVARAQATAVAARMASIRKTLRIEWPSDLHNGCLRIGYVSGDFREHPTAHLTRKLFRVHDRRRFKVIGFSLRPNDGSQYWRDIATGCDQFVELTEMSHAEAAAHIAKENIHILVDMHGYTRFARPELFALQPAPIQVTFLGYPGTLGADYIPYIIADRVVLPRELRPCFTEQPIYLDCYQVNDDEQWIAATGITRADAGLPEYGFVYCCFNNLSKIDPQTFSVWMRILKQVPESVLWLLAGRSNGVKQLCREAEAYGVNPERLVFASRLPKNEHLERHRLADLFLDTFVYNAHTTASDALWAGLPVLTLQGSAFQSRVCTSLLTTLGLRELIAVRDVHEYEEKALALAGSPDRLQALRTRLNKQRTISLPFATTQFVNQLEQAYWSLWCDYAKSE